MIITHPAGKGKLRLMGSNIKEVITLHKKFLAVLLSLCMVIGFITPSIRAGAPGRLPGAPFPFPGFSGKSHKGSRSRFGGYAQAQMQFEHKSAQFAQIDAIRGKLVLNSWS